MRNTFLATIAAATLLSGAFAYRATAVTLLLPVAVPPDAARITAVTPVVNVCGTHGCVTVQTKKVIHHQKPGNTVPHHI